MTQAQQALATIQAYGAPAPPEDDHTYTRGLWEAVIQRSSGSYPLFSLGSLFPPVFQAATA